MRNWPIIAEKQLKSKQVVRRLIRSFNIPPPGSQFPGYYFQRLARLNSPSTPQAKIAFRCLTHYWTILSVINSECYGHVCENCPSKLFAHKGRLFNFKLLHENTCITPERLDTSSSNAPPHLGKVHLPPPPGTDDGEMPVGEFPGGMLKLRKGHFRITFSLFFKTRPGAQPLLWKWV